MLYLNLGPAIPNVFQISVKGFTAKMFSSVFLNFFFFFKEKTLLASGNFSPPTSCLMFKGNSTYSPPLVYVIAMLGLVDPSHPFWIPW